MKQTRMKTVWAFGASLVAITIMSILKDMAEVAVIGTAAVAGIVAKYNHDETKRSSKKQNQD